jgi:hypothetical protein
MRLEIYNSIVITLTVDEWFSCVSLFPRAKNIGSPSAMNTKSAIRLASFVLSLALALGIASEAVAQITTNGNLGATDVGAWYAPYWITSGSSWSNANGTAINNLPLAYWTTLSTSAALSGTYEPYDSSNSTVIANDLSALAAAKIDFIVFDLSNATAAEIAAQSGIVHGAAQAGLIAAAINTWNANPSNTWKIRYAIAIGGFGSGSDIEALAEAVNRGFVTNTAYGGSSNYYQINSQPLLVPTSVGEATFPSAWTSYCSANPSATGCGFYMGWALAQGAGQWGWQLPDPGLTPYDSVDPTNLVEEVLPGWDNYLGAFAAEWISRRDGATYQNNWDVVYNSHPRIVLLTAYNDWWEQTGVFYNDTATMGVPPSPAYDPYSDFPYPTPLNGRWPESWTLPDENITLGGYWDYTKAAICYLRNGDSYTECSSSASPAPYWPQPAPNLAVTGTAIASSCVDNNCTTGSWIPSNAADGNPWTVWSSVEHTSGSVPGGESITLSWSSAQTFNTVVLMGRSDIPNCFPVTFEIDAKIAGSWTQLVVETNFPQPTISGQPISFTWGKSVMATDVRVSATQLSPDQFGGYYFQLGEFEVLNETSTATAPFFANWGFEHPAQGATSPYWQYPSMPYGWTFTGNHGTSNSAGVEENCCIEDSSYNPTTYWGAAQAPQGVQTAFLEGTGSVSQSVNFPTGSYDIRFLAAQRTYAGSAQGISVTLDPTTTNLNILTVNPVDPSGNFVPYVTNSFTVATPGVHTITFAGTQYAGGDDTAFIDEVQIFNTTSIGANLLTNPSWATGDLSGWSVGGSAAYLTPGSGYNGDPYVLNLNNPSGSSGVVAYQDLSGQTAGNSFSASVYAETSSSTTGAFMAVQDGTGAYLCAASIPAGVSSWTMYSCTYNVPPSGNLRFQVSSNYGSAGAWTKLDNAALFVVNNLLVNPSWSSGLSGPWYVAGTTSAASLLTSGGYNGDAYVLDENSTSGSFNVVAYQDVTGQPGHSFTASVYVQTSSSTPNAYIGVQDGSTPSYPCTMSIPAGVSSWTMYSCTGTVPPSGNLRFLLSSDEESVNDWTYFDSPSLVVF